MKDSVLLGVPFESKDAARDNIRGEDSGVLSRYTSQRTSSSLGVVPFAVLGAVLQGRHVVCVSACRAHARGVA